MYTSCFLASLLYLIEHRPNAALLAFGIACSLKPQAIFWCPLLGALLITGDVPWQKMWIPVTVYASCGVPQMIAGRPVTHTLEHWFRVSDYPGLVHGAPNWYQWIGTVDGNVFWWPGVLVTLCISAWFILWVKKGPKTGVARPRWLVSIAMASVTFPPSFLPGMHERVLFFGRCSFDCLRILRSARLGRNASNAARFRIFLRAVSL